MTIIGNNQNNYRSVSAASEFNVPSFQEFVESNGGNYQQVINPQMLNNQKLNNTNKTTSSNYLNNNNVAFSSNQGMDTVQLNGGVEQNVQTESVKQDKSNDGKFSLGQCLKNFGKGVGKFFGDTLKAIKEHPVKALLMAGAAIAVVASGPIGAAIVAGVGLSIGAWNLGTGIVKVATNLAKGDKDGAEEAFVDIGKGTTETALSLIGFGSAMKGVNAAAAVSKGATATKVLGASKYLKAGAFKAIKTDVSKAFKVGFDADWRAMTINTVKQPAKFLNKFRNADRAVKLNMYTKVKLAKAMKGTKQAENTSFFQRYSMAKDNNLLKSKILTRRHNEQLKFDFSKEGVVNGYKNFKQQAVSDVEADLGTKMARNLNKSNKARVVKGKEAYWSEVELQAFKNFKFKNPIEALKGMDKAARNESLLQGSTGLSTKLSEMG